ncbi:MAG: sigma-54-dependent Fis family transcriptional regulator [Ignavibacteriae bacterium]|nr:sigma-54-dependent Fis family transcriptional regulator [Ignavibacteriota bacterium]MCB9257982.1 sigma-54-dependent Fis family transcriptional regulator [Ignavibacteriales bacterium]
MSNEAEKSDAIFELIKIVSKLNDFSEILRIITTKITIMFDTDVTTIKMINPKTEDTCRTIFNKERKNQNVKYEVIQSSLIGLVIKYKEPIIITELINDDRFTDNVFSSDDIKSAICVPILYTGVTKGYLLVLRKKNKKSFNKSDLNFLENLMLVVSPHICNIQKIQEFFNLPLTQNSILNKYNNIGLLGKSKKFIELLQSIEAASKCDARVVVEGETGTGKELVVKAIHKFSSRAALPFIAVDCGAIPENLVESELFGHIKGSFTGANRDRTGLIIEADKGTLFLDEICNLSFEMQSKLLRVLQESEVRPIGSSKVIKVDVRFIAATSKPLINLVEKGEFREDLYFRLMVYPIKVPTLIERKGDIPIIANYFLRKISKQQDKKAEFFHSDLMEYFKNKNWSGNIRQLENYIERIVTIIPKHIETIDLSILNFEIKNEVEKFKEAHKKKNKIRLIEEVEKLEKEIIEQTLEENDWNQSQSARLLEIPEQTLRYKMKKFGLNKFMRN